MTCRYDDFEQDTQTGHRIHLVSPSKILASQPFHPGIFTKKKKEMRYEKKKNKTILKNLLNLKKIKSLLRRHVYKYIQNVAIDRCKQYLILALHCRSFD